MGSPHSEPSAFWGIDYVGDHAGGPAVADLEKTPIRSAVFPSGNVTEHMNLSSGIIYDQGHTSPAGTTMAEFASECEQLGCHAIIGLPMEVDNPGVDVADARYIVQTLDFHPAFFLYGNEPAHWDCFGTSWAALAKGACSGKNATPVEFATETATVVASVDRALGASAPPTMCLGGSGAQGPTPEIEYIDALLANAYDKTACEAFAMHAHPASSQLETPTLANFYSTLVAFNGVAADYHNASTATDGKPLYMTEVGEVTRKSVFVGYEGTWAWNVYAAAELVQGMQNLVPNYGWWAWNTGGKDGLFLGKLSPTYTLFSTFAPRLGSTWLSTNQNGASGMFVEVTHSGNTWTLLAVNTNINTGVQVLFTGSGFPDGGPAGLITWTASGLSNSSQATLLGGVQVPAQSVVLVTISAFG